MMNKPEKHKMKKITIYLIFISLILLSSCKVEDIVSELGSSEITAKAKVGEVVNKSKSDFAGDSKLAAIYGLNVNNEGKIDLLKPTDNAFVYVVQSDSVVAVNPPEANQFYVPVYNSTPIRSPISFGSMLGLIKDQGASEIMGRIFGKLATISIDASASYDDSPQVLNKMLTRSDVSTFRLNNPDTKIDMFLLPSKSIDSTSINNSVDWIVNFYGTNTSLVLWLHPGTVNGTIKNLNEL
jgi:hypothetical protein